MARPQCVLPRRREGVPHLFHQQPRRRGDGNRMELPRHHAARTAGDLGRLAKRLPADSAVQVVELARQLRRRAHAPPEVGRYPNRPSRSGFAKARGRGKIGSPRGCCWSRMSGVNGGGMNSTTPGDYFSGSGPVDARYLAFLETISTLRPSLHRYCARMTGSVMDGEDVVQEALFEAYRKLDKFDQSRPLKPWLFRIAHNRCIDFLRRRGVRDDAEVAVAVPEATHPVDPVLGTGKAVEHLVLTLPPKERACVILKDVFDYSLEEIAELVDSTVGGVKAALNRARSKLAESSPSLKSARRVSPELKRVMQLYVERFNRRDWDGVRELTSSDARLNVAERFAGKFADAAYFYNYDRWPWPWKLALGEVEGEAVVIILRRGADTWTPHSAIRFDVSVERIGRIVDYIHCPWVLLAASTVTV